MKRLVMTFSKFAIVLAVLCPATLFADVQLQLAEEQAFKQAAALVEPSIVRVQTVGGLDRVGRVLVGTGPTTGVAVSKDGYIISSAFNFISKPASILVELPDGRRLPANVVATDRSRMLTLLKIEADDLVPPAAAPKKEMRVGQWAVALGRTFEAERSNISVGIISALNRVWGKAIQTDAKVSPANYGGPLVDVQGRVLGILVPMSPQGNDETAGVEWYDGGIGFAVPMEDVFAALDRLKEGKDLKPGLMGIEFAGRDQLAGEPVIDRVRVDSPAQKAGFQKGDKIVEVDGKPVVRQAEVKMALGTKYGGDKVIVAVKRKDETIRQELTLVEELTAYESGFLGILPTRPASDEPAAAGVQVRHVFAGSPAEKAGLAARDRVLKFNGVEVNSAAALRDQVGRMRPKEKAEIVFIRGGKEQTATIEVAAIPNEVVPDLTPVFIPPAEEGKDDDAEEDKAKDDAAGPAAAEDEPDDDANALRLGRFQDKSANGEHEWWAYVPEDYNPKHRYGLMVWIHPSDDTMEAAIFRQWQTVCDARGILLVAPKAAKLGGWNLDEAEFVKETVEQMTAKYSIDPGRVFLHSFGSGGKFAWHLAFKHRELYRGAAISGQPLAERPPENDPLHRQQFHLTCGEQDPILKAVEATVKGLQTLKFPTSFTKEPDREHRYPAAETVPEIARWADSLDRI